MPLVIFSLFDGALRVEQVLHVKGRGRVPIKLAPSPDPAPGVGVQLPGHAVAPAGRRRYHAGHQRVGAAGYGCARGVAKALAGRTGKYTFAELEESEQDLEKLARWLAKIHARDFFPGKRGQEAGAMLARCQAAVEAFSQSVYAAEEVTGSGGRGPQAPGGDDTGQTDPIQPV
jgi:hypothetical protein